MAYARKNRSARRRAPVARRRPARRTSVRRTAARRSSARRGPQTVKIVIEHSTQAGDGMGGMEMPQVIGQNKKARF